MRWQRAQRNTNLAQAAEGNVQGAAGLTTLEIVIGTLFTLVALVVLLPGVIQSLVMHSVFWEIRQANFTIASRLDWACQEVGQKIGNIYFAGTTPPSIDFSSELPEELAGSSSSGLLSWNYVNPATLAYTVSQTNLLEATASIGWVSRGHPMSKTMGRYISQTGLCAGGP